MLSSFKNYNKSQLSLTLTESAFRTVDFFTSKLQDSGSYGDEIQDIACYFKSPMMFLLANKKKLALLLLTYIKKNFLMENGDFKTSSHLKSANDAYNEYWSYINGWLIRASNYLNFDEITKPAYKYFMQYYLGNAGFLTNNIENNSSYVDILTIAHHGLVNLELNNLEIATTAGNLLYSALSQQPDLSKGFYLRLNLKGNLVTDFSIERMPFFFIDKKMKNQLHFMVGYPAAYLTLLYNKTNQSDYLKIAQEYLDFSLSCHKNVYECNFSHKLAWAASLLYKSTQDKKYLDIIYKITDYFIRNQNNGMWFTNDIITSYDQSAEIAYWFLEIVKNINSSIN